MPVEPDDFTGVVQEIPRMPPIGYGNDKRSMLKHISLPELPLPHAAGTAYPAGDRILSGCQSTAAPPGIKAPPVFPNCEVFMSSNGPFSLPTFFDASLPMLKELLPDIMSCSAAGLVGEGSECLGLGRRDFPRSRLGARILSVDTR